MGDSKFKTMRHIETVRNFINTVIQELLQRGELHDQSKLEPPEVETFEIYTAKLRNCTYGSDEYKQYLAEMKPAIDHHNKFNRHHPEHFKVYECNGCFKQFDSMPDWCDVCYYSQFTIREKGIAGMNLIDLIEMICDWKAASLRHNDGDIHKSIEINQKRFGYSEELKSILENTVNWIENQIVYHKAKES